LRNREREKIGFVWVCFLHICKDVYFHNTLLILYLRSFEYPTNWVCFALFLFRNGTINHEVPEGHERINSGSSPE